MYTLGNLRVTQGIFPNNLKRFFINPSNPSFYCVPTYPTPFLVPTAASTDTKILTGARVWWGGLFPVPDLECFLFLRQI